MSCEHNIIYEQDEGTGFWVGWCSKCGLWSGWRAVKEKCRILNGNPFRVRIGKKK